MARFGKGISQGGSDAVLLRFVTGQRHPPFGHRSGVFQAAYGLRDAPVLDAAERSELAALLVWFDEKLPVPTRFAASRRAHAEDVGLSWLRASATAHISRMIRLARLMEEAGEPVDMLRTRRPGYILYEDTVQIVALPFADLRA